MYSVIGTWRMSFEGCKKAEKILKEDGDISEAILSAINDVENNPDFHSVGYSGLPDISGQVTCDAAYMNGDNLKYGAVGDLKNIRNSVNVAELLSHEESCNFLVADGALKYATDHGMTETEMLTDSAEKIYLEKKNEIEKLTSYHDTVCFIVMKDRHIHCGTSTSGLFLKKEGRLGDTPLCGAGFYCDSRYGACCGTGVGEDISRGVLSYRCVTLMKEGMSVREAVEKTLYDFCKDIENCRDISLIAMDHRGNVAGATNSRFAYTHCDSDTTSEIRIQEYIGGQLIERKPTDEDKKMID